MRPELKAANQYQARATEFVAPHLQNGARFS
jgi:hypothetical protein